MLFRSPYYSVSQSRYGLVVEDSTVAKECIEFLKQRKLGRASFLPFDTVKPFNAAKIEGKGIIGLASDLVNYDSKFEKIVKFVLGNILVVEDIDSGVRVSKEGKFSGSIVSLEGEIISGRGKISGGEKVKSGISVIFERKREINQLEGDIKINRDKLKEVTLVYDENNKKSNEISTQISNISIQEENNRRELYDLNGKKGVLEKEHKSILNNYETILYEKEAEEDNLKSLMSKIETGTGESSLISEKIESIKKLIDSKEKQGIIQKKIYDELSEIYSNGRIEAAKFSEQLKTYQGKIYYEKKELQEYTDNKKRNEARIEIVRAGKRETEEEIIKLTEEKSGLDENYKITEEKLKSEKEKYKQIEQKEKEGIAEIRSIESKIVSEKNSFTKKCEEIEKIKSDIENILVKSEEAGGMDESEPAEDHLKEKREYVS